MTFLRNSTLLSTVTLSLVLVAGLVACKDSTEKPAEQAEKSQQEQNAPEQLAQNANTKKLIPDTDNIVFLVIDTLRADHLPFYNYPIDTAPFLNEIASKAIVFENAYGGCSSTAPAMASVFTSVYPSQHGVITGKRATQRLKDKNANLTLNKIPASFLTVSELISQSGYYTAGVADNLNIDSDMGFLDGFSVFNTFKYEGAPKVNATVESYKPQLKSPYFLYIHYMDPHSPYNKRAPWFDKSVKNKQLAAYDSEIRYTDEHIKQLFAQFSWMEDALIVFFSDHGEELGDHGLYGHGKNLYTESIHVPLMFYHKSFQARRVKDIVHTIDILPTMAEILGRAQENYWEGKSLVKFLTDKDHNSQVHDTVFSQLLRVSEHSKDKKETALDSESWQYISNEEGATRDELFDLNTDPGSKTNVAEVETNQQKLSNLKDALKKLDSKGTSKPTEEVNIEMDQETIDNLRTLGYIQ